MIEKTNLNQTMARMYTNVNGWDYTVDNGITILEKNYELMADLAKFEDYSYSSAQQKNLIEIFKKTKEISACLITEKTQTLEKIKQTNQSNKIANQYITGFSDSYFIDKDF